MNEEANTPPAPLALKKPDSTWWRAVGVMRRNPRATLLPIAVTQMPFAVITAVVFFYLFNNQYPNAEFKTLDALAKGPDGVRLTVLLLGAAQTLFGLVGAAATIVAVDQISKGKTPRLADSLDPAFTRMGGLFALGTAFFLMFIGTLAGVIVLLYLLLRFGLALHAYTLEDRTVTGAFGRSWRLMKGRMLRFIGLLLTVPAVGLIVVIVSSIAIAILSLPFGTEPSRDPELIIFCVSALVGGIMAVPMYAYLATVTTLFYLSATEQTGE